MFPDYAHGFAGPIGGARPFEGAISETGSENNSTDGNCSDRAESGCILSTVWDGYNKRMVSLCAWKQMMQFCEW
jgi:hypothetical protein